MVLGNIDETAFMTAAELAERCGVSESSITRFSMTVGYPGYPEFQDGLQTLVKRKLTIVERLSLPPRREADSTLSAIMLRDIRSIQELMADLEPETVGAAASALREARHRYVIGIRSAAALATFLGFYLRLLVGPTTVVGAESEDWTVSLFDISKDDAVVALSFPRYGAWTVSAFEFASTRCGTAIAITDGYWSPLARDADIVLTAPTSSGSFLESFVAPLSLINVLLLLIGTDGGTASKERLSQMEELWTMTGALINAGGSPAA